MKRVVRYAGQGAAFALFVAAIGWLANGPAYTHLPPDQALIKLSISHGAERRECRQRTAEELARLPANMRRALDCTRERLPVDIELAIDERVVYRATLPPSGLAGDGPSRTYRRFALPAGPHRIVARLRDRPHEGFDYERAALVDLAPRQSFVIDFRPEAGGFVFR